MNATAKHRTVYTTQIVDVDRNRRLNVVEGRSADVLAGWLTERSPVWCEQITLDPATGYVRFDNRPEFVAHAVNDWCRFNHNAAMLIDDRLP